MITLRNVKTTDAAALAGIYAPYVRHTAISFELEAPDEDEFRRRIAHTLQNYPYIVAELDGRIAGYAYAGKFQERPAYAWAVETSIYVDSHLKHAGIGTMLHQRLEETLRKNGFQNMNACIAYTDETDSHLNNDSILFHQKMGYTPVAHFHKCGYKFGKWYDMVWMEKLIGTHGTPTHTTKY